MNISCWSLLLTFERILDSWVKRAVAWKQSGREYSVKYWKKKKIVIRSHSAVVWVFNFNPKHPAFEFWYRKKTFLFFSVICITLVYSTAFLKVSSNVTMSPFYPTQSSKVYSIYFLRVWNFHKKFQNSVFCPEKIRKFHRTFLYNYLYPRILNSTLKFIALFFSVHLQIYVKNCNFHKLPTLL